MCIQIQQQDVSFEYDENECFYEQMKKADLVKIKYAKEDSQKISNFVERLEDGLSKGVIPLIAIDVDYDSYLKGYAIKKKLGILARHSEINKLINLLVLSQFTLDSKLKSLHEEIVRISNYAKKEA
jgi:hypothetical protein